MLKRLKLPTKSGALLLGAAEWCDVLIDVGEGGVPLGADSRGVVVERLATMLRAETLDAASGTVEGVEVAWVASFSERHGSLYAGDADGGRLLYAQVESGAIVAKLTLTGEDRVEWLRLLDRTPPR